MEILLKRFLKYNKSLVAVIGVSLLLVLALLVIAVAKYLDMINANNEVNKMRTSISDLQDPHKNKVAVIAGNLGRLKKDFEIYKKQNEKMRPYFGHPYAKAIDAMAIAMGEKSGEEFIRKFYAFLSEGSESTYNRYQRFKIQNSAKWNRAISVFSKEAQKVSFEKITPANVDDIFQQAIGLPRNMTGRSQEHCSNLITNMELQLNKFVLDRNIDVNKEAAAFSLKTPGLANPDQIANSMQNMEIIGDMIPRIMKNIPKDHKNIKVIDKVSFEGKSQYRDDQKITVYKYKLNMSVSMNALRNIIKNLNTSVLDSRIYILRDIKMKVKPEEDQAAMAIGLVAAPVLKDKDGKVIEIKYRDDSHLPYHQRRDYGKVIVGSNQFFDVEMEIDYMILKLHEYQKR